jgi:hypothetical protein
VKISRRFVNACENGHCDLRSPVDGVRGLQTLYLRYKASHFTPQASMKLATNRTLFRRGSCCAVPESYMNASWLKSSSVAALYNSGVQRNRLACLHLRGWFGTSHFECRLTRAGAEFTSLLPPSTPTGSRPVCVLTVASTSFLSISSSSAAGFEAVFHVSIMRFSSLQIQGECLVVILRARVSPADASRSRFMMCSV